MTTTTIGQIEYLRTRVFPLDAAQGRSDRIHTEIVVAPGRYDVVADRYGCVWTELTGHINGRPYQKLGDGLFAMGGMDGPNMDQPVAVPGKVFGPEEWAEFLNDPAFTGLHGDVSMRWHPA